MVALGQGTYRLDGTPRMRQRPVADLLAGARPAWGRTRGATSAPVARRSPSRPSGLDGGYAFVKGDVSSQFLSGLLMALPYARETTTVEVEGTLVSQPYVAMTLAVMEAFGVRIGNRKFRRFDVRPARYQGRAYAIEPDASAASYFFAARGDHRRRRSPSRGWAPTASRATSRSWTCSSTWAAPSSASADATTVTGGPLRGVDVDMNAISDTVMTLAVVALFASGHHADPQRRPHPPQGDRPDRRPRDRAPQARRDRRRAATTA